MKKKTVIIILGVTLTVGIISLIGLGFSSGVFSTVTFLQPQDLINQITRGHNKRIENRRVGYSVVVPSRWKVTKGVEEKTDVVTLISENKAADVAQNGIDVSYYAMATDQKLIQCIDAGPSMDNCLDAIAPSGTLFTITTTYRPNQRTIDDAVAADGKQYAQILKYQPAEKNIAGEKTYIQVRNPDLCADDNCQNRWIYDFYGGDNFQYEIDARVFVSSHDNMSTSKKKDYVHSQQIKIDNIINSFAFLK